MKDETLRKLVPLLDSDETIAPSQSQRAIEILSGSVASTQTGYLRKTEAAAYLGIALRTLTDWMNAGLLPYVKVGNTPLFRARDMDKALDQFRHKAVGER